MAQARLIYRVSRDVLVEALQACATMRTAAGTATCVDCRAPLSCVSEVLLTFSMIGCLAIATAATSAVLATVTYECHKEAQGGSWWADHPWKRVGVLILALVGLRTTAHI